MKLRYLFSIILSALFFAGCADISTDSWDNIKLSQTYVSIPAGGGTTNVTINATEDWAFVVGEDWPAWLTVDKLTGAAGESTVSFSAEAVNGGRSAELQIKAGSNTQFVNVCQGSKSVTKATVAEIIAGPEGKLYEVRGVCTSVSNTTYGNWYLKDDSTDKELYIYGTVDASGKYNWASFNIEPGDVVTVQGSYVLYGGNTPEFVDAAFIKVEKALVKVVTEEKTIAKEGEQFDVKVAYKGDGIFPSVPEEHRSWVSIVDMKSKPGVASKIDPNPADTAIVRIAVLPNEGGDRNGSVSFSSGSSTVPYNIFQKGAIIETTADKINAAEDGATQYRYTGCVTKIANSKYGNIYIADYTGEVYAYGTYDAAGNRFDAFSTPVNVYDIVTVVGPKTSYNGSPQMKNVTVEKHISVKAATVAEFLAAPEAKDVYYSLTGTVSNIANTLYGNFDIVDETGSVYVYGLLQGWGGPSKMFESLGLKEGDKITIVGVRSGYKGTAQVGSAFFVSKAE